MEVTVTARAVDTDDWGEPVATFDISAPVDSSFIVDRETDSFFGFQPIALVNIGAEAGRAGDFLTMIRRVLLDPSSPFYDASLDARLSQLNAESARQLLLARKGQGGEVGIYRDGFRVTDIVLLGVGSSGEFFVNQPEAMHPEALYYWDGKSFIKMEGTGIDPSRWEAYVVKDGLAVVTKDCASTYLEVLGNGKRGTVASDSERCN